MHPETFSAHIISEVSPANFAAKNIPVPNFSNHQKVKSIVIGQELEAFQNPCIKVVESLLGSGNSTSEDHDSQTIIHDIKIDSDRLF